MKTAQIEHSLKLQLEWVRAADSKIPPLFAITIAMLGTISALAKSQAAWSLLPGIPTAFAVIFLLASIGCLVLAVRPNTSGPKSSNVFFGGIAEKDIDKFIAECTKGSEDEYRVDLLKQTHRNAEIARDKYRFVGYAFNSFFIAVPFWFFSVYVLYS